MRRLITLLAAVALVFGAPVSAFAESSTVSYSSCLTTSQNDPITDMQVRVDNTQVGYADQNGCFTAQVEAGIDHIVDFMGKNSLLSEVPNTNGFYYTFEYRTGELSQDTTANHIIPVTAITFDVNGVDNTSIVDPSMTLAGMKTLSLPDGSDMYVRIRGELARMQGAGNTILFGVPNDMETNYEVKAASSYGFEPKSDILPEQTGGQVTVPITMQYPAPDMITDLTQTVDTSGHAEMHWTPSPNATHTRIYDSTTGIDTLVADLPGTASSYDVGQLPHQGSYSYTVHVANQYGYEGNNSTGVTINWDLNAPIAKIY